MDFDLRDWLLILGPVFVSVVLIHGYWRMRRGQGELRMSLDKSFLDSTGETGLDELSLLKAELPNGGARVAVEEVPVLMEPVEIETLRPATMPTIQEKRVADVVVEADNEPILIEPLTPRAPPVRKPPVRKPIVDKPEKFVVINVLSDDHFAGQVLLEALLALNMTFGDMEIFHRLDETGDTLFSLVNAVEPGSFDPGMMDKMQTPGVTFFMRAHELADPVNVYDRMVEAAQTLVLELGGELMDESRSVITTQTIDHCRQGIQDFQYKHSA